MRKAIRRRLVTGAITCVGVVALGGVSAASALATPPEFFTGGAPVAAAIPFTSESGPGTLENKAGEKIQCTSDKNIGSIKNGKETVVTITFEGCTALGGVATCTNTGKAGQIVVGPLKDHLVIIFGGSGVGDLLYPESEEFPPAEPPEGGTVTEFTCEFLGIQQPVVVRGSVIGEFPTLNEELTSTELVLKQTGGVQAFTEYETEEGGEVRKAFLESSINGAAFQQAGEETEDTIKTEEPVEIRG